MPGQNFVDDPAIMDDDDLWRRVHPTQVVPDPKAEQGWRPSSGAFKDPQLSVDVAKDSTVERTLRGYQQYSLVTFTAKLARSLKQIVTYNRKEDNQAHALVVGHKSGGTARKLANGSEWVMLRKPER
jgi:hypothetical protein